jgi:hypothetical protein
MYRIESHLPQHPSRKIYDRIRMNPGIFINISSRIVYGRVAAVAEVAGAVRTAIQAPQEKKELGIAHRCAIAVKITEDSYTQMRKS